MIFVSEDTLDCMGLAHIVAQCGEKAIVWEKKKTGIGQGYTNIEMITTNFEKFVESNKDELFIFEGSEHGGVQDRMRAEGLKVIGSSSLGEKIEDKIYGYNLAKRLHIPVPESWAINSIDETIKFIKENPAPYIVKQSGNLPKGLNYKAKRNDGYDVILHLLTSKKQHDNLEGQLLLQRCVEGVEVAVTAFFDGYDWVPYCIINYENKRLLQGNLGPMTGETGTGAYVEAGLGENRIFQQCLSPLTPLLRHYHHTGPVDANCIVTVPSSLDKLGSRFHGNKAEQIRLVEITARWGYPISNLLHELMDIPFTDFLRLLVSGPSPAGREILKNGYKFNSLKGIVLTLELRGMPYKKEHEKMDNFKGEALGLWNLTQDDMKHIQLQDCSVEEFEGVKHSVIASEYGYACSVTGTGKNFNKANESAWNLLNKINIADKGIARPDIGEQVTKRYKQIH